MKENLPGVYEAQKLSEAFSGCLSCKELKAALHSAEEENEALAKAFKDDHERGVELLHSAEERARSGHEKCMEIIDGQNRQLSLAKDALEDIGGLDCVAAARKQSPCRFCFSCVARKALGYLKVEP